MSESTETNPQIEDKDREKYDKAKWQISLRQAARLFVPERNKAIAKVSKFCLIDIQAINKLLGTNFKGMIVDVDETLGEHHGEIQEENIEEILNLVKQGIRIVLFSNMKFSPRYEPLIQRVKEETGYEIKVILSQYAKPDERGFEESCKALELEPEEVVMAGDNYLTDGGSIGAGVQFIKVKPVKTHNDKHGPVRELQKLTRGFYTLVSQIYDMVGQRKVLRDKDLFQALKEF